MARMTARCTSMFGIPNMKSMSAVVPLRIASRQPRRAPR